MRASPQQRSFWAVPLSTLVGNALFKWALWGYVPRSRRIGIVVVALAPIALVAPILVLLAGATAVLVAAWDTLAFRPAMP